MNGEGFELIQGPEICHSERSPAAAGRSRGIAFVRSKDIVQAENDFSPRSHFGSK